ncbi:MAG: ABC transporter substrate-binding protein, partial [Actinomycetota bacterium]
MSALFLATIALVASCSNSAAPSPDPTRPIVVSAVDFKLPVVGDGSSKLPTTVMSADEIEVTVTDTSRIIVLNEAIAEIVISLGFIDKIIGRDATTTIESLTAVPKVSSGHDISAESILELRPTLVIGDTRSGPPEAIQQLRGAGLAIVLAPEVWRLADIQPRIDLISKALGAQDLG